MDDLAQPEFSFFREDCSEGRPGHELEYRVEDALVRLPRVDQSHDVRMCEPGAQVHLAPEAVGLHPDVCNTVVRPQAQDLDSNLLRGRELACFVDPAIAARTELGEDLVSTLKDR